MKKRQGTGAIQAWLRRAILLLVAAGVAGGLRVQAAGYRMPITFGGYSNRTETLTNFPVLVVLSNGVGGSSFHFGTTPLLSTNGWDLRFKTNLNDTGESTLKYEIESINTNTAAYVWVQVPLLQSNGLSGIWATWGDSADSNQLACTTNGTTWDSSFRAVWHFANGQGVDSTTNGNNGSPVSITASNGLAGQAAWLNGSSSLIGVKASPTYSGDKTGTISAVANLKTLPANDTSKSLHQLGGSDNLLFAFGVRRHPNLGGVNSYLDVFERASDGASRGWSATSTVLANNTYYHFALRSDDAAWSMLVNGSVQSLSSWYGGANNGNWFGDTAPNSPTNAIGAGKYNNNMGSWWDGAIDELRISSVQRSTNWLWAESQTVLANTAFGAYGNVLAATPLVSNSGATGLTVNAAWLTGTLVSTGGSVTAWGVLWGTNNPGAMMTGWLGGGSHEFGAATAENVSTSFQATALASGVTYYYTYWATNAAGTNVAQPTAFAAYQVPTVDNTDGATAIGARTAVLRGTVTAGTPAPQVFFCLSRNAAGDTSTGSWEQVTTVGSASGAFSTTARGLQPNTLYYYRCYATNAAGDGWAPAAASFATSAESPFNLASNHTLNSGVALVGTNPAVTLPFSTGWLYDFGGYGFTNFNMGGYYLRNINVGSVTLDLAGGPIAATRTATSFDLKAGDSASEYASSLILTNPGTVRLGKVWTYVAPQYRELARAAGNVTIGANTPGGRAGAVEIAEINASAGDRYCNNYGGNVAIHGTSFVRIWDGATAGNIYTYCRNRNDMNVSTLGGNVTVYHDGAFLVNTIDTSAERGVRGGAISLNGDVLGDGPSGAFLAGELRTALMTNWVLNPSPSPVAVQGYGDVTITNGVFTYSQGTGDNSFSGGAISITNNSGNMVIGTNGLQSYTRATYAGRNGGAVSLATSGGSIAIAGSVLTYTTGSASSGVGGDISMTAASGITIAGSVDATAGAGAASAGTLALTTTAGDSQISLNALDLALVKSARFSAGGGKTMIAGALLNFPTNTPANGKLYALTGQTVRYKAAVSGNAYLDGRTYTLAGGGVLKPWMPGGTLITIW